MLRFCLVFLALGLLTACEGGSSGGGGFSSGGGSGGSANLGSSEAAAIMGEANCLASVSAQTGRSGTRILSKSGNSYVIAAPGERRAYVCTTDSQGNAVDIYRQVAA
ncbi:MAG: hypothetical protein ACPGNV_18025 [Mangrovicoccus sp.]